MKTFKTGLDVLLSSKRKEEDAGYAVALSYPKRNRIRNGPVV
jgi:hypothetical protein